MSRVEKAWYGKSAGDRIISWLMAPLSVVFWAVSAARRTLFRLGLKRTQTLPVPVIVVGNISVGGNGKTPLVIRLAQWLRQQGYQPGVVSRGYGGKGAVYPAEVLPDSDPAMVGDEPVLMRQHLGCPMVVDPKRPRGARWLVEQAKCDVILCDDGLQHYALGRDIEIAVLDGVRRNGNGHLLPMGPLREGTWRLDKVNFVVCNGGVAQNGEHLMSLESGQLVNVRYPNQTRSINDLHKSAVAVAAIGNPERFFDLLKQKRVKLDDCIAFADHHKFTETDLPKRTVLMTEKDAVKCRDFAHEDWWYLPVSAKLTDAFKQQLLDSLKQLKHKK